MIKSSSRRLCIDRKIALLITFLQNEQAMHVPEPNRRLRLLKKHIHYLVLVMLLLPVVVFLYFLLDFLLSEPNPSMFEDIDQWCEQYRPELTYSQCMDEAGL